MCKYFLLSLLLLTNFISISARELIVGTTSAYAPFVSLDEQGEYEGFDIDVVNALAGKLDRSIIIKDLGSMPSLFLALKQGKVDILIWGISITEERQKQMDMVYYQGEKVTSLPLLFWKTIPENISSLEDMANLPKAVICVEAGSFQEHVVQKVPGLSLKNVDKVMDAILEIKYGKSMATLIDSSLLAKYTDQFPEIKLINIPLPSSDQALGNGICINKKNTALAAEIRQAVKELREERVISQLEEKWNLVGQ
jgi:arginine transport system substrate-binding protein